MSDELLPAGVFTRGGIWFVSKSPVPEAIEERILYVVAVKGESGYLPLFTSRTAAEQFIREFDPDNRIGLEPFSLDSAAEFGAMIGALSDRYEVAAFDPGRPHVETLPTRAIADALRHYMFPGGDN